MKKPVNLLPPAFRICGKTYFCEFDMKTLDLLEFYLHKGLYEIFDVVFTREPDEIPFLTSLLCVSVIKNHGLAEAYALKQKLLKAPDLKFFDFFKFKLYFEKLFPGKEFADELKSSPTKSVEPKRFFDFAEAYACARNLLSWTESEFWTATPRKLCFALIAQKKYNDCLFEMQRDARTKNAIELLKNVKNII